MIRHVVGALEPKSLGSVGADHAYLLYDSLVLPSPQELKNNHDLPACASYVRHGMRVFSKISFLLYADSAALNPTTTRQVSLKI
jgi:hypothetical protein